MNALEKVLVVVFIVFALTPLWLGYQLVTRIDSIEARDEAVRPAEVGSVPQVWCECHPEGFTSSCVVVGEGLVLLSL